MLSQPLSAPLLPHRQEPPSTTACLRWRGLSSYSTTAPPVRWRSIRQESTFSLRRAGASMPFLQLEQPFLNIQRGLLSWPVTVGPKWRPRAHSSHLQRTGGGRRTMEVGTSIGQLYQKPPKSAGSCCVVAANRDAEDAANVWEQLFSAQLSVTAKDSVLEWAEWTLETGLVDFWVHSSLSLRRTLFSSELNGLWRLALWTFECTALCHCEGLCSWMSWMCSLEIGHGLMDFWVISLCQCHSYLSLYLRCGCKQGCRGRCKCVRAALQCTALCHCEGPCSWVSWMDSGDWPCGLLSAQLSVTEKDSVLEWALWRLAMALWTFELSHSVNVTVTCLYICVVAANRDAEDAANVWEQLFSAQLSVTAKDPVLEWVEWTLETGLVDFWVHSYLSLRRTLFLNGLSGDWPWPYGLLSYLTLSMSQLLVSIFESACPWCIATRTFSINVHLNHAFVVDNTVNSAKT